MKPSTTTKPTTKARSYPPAPWKRGDPIPGFMGEALALWRRSAELRAEFAHSADAFSAWLRRRHDDDLAQLRREMAEYRQRGELP